MTLRPSSRFLPLVVFLAGAAIAAMQESVPSGDWADSPQAIFLTSRERSDWFALKTAVERERFKVRYWARRDPTPATERNEFRDVVINRIREADARFGVNGTPGSETARGYVYVLLGSPAHVLDTHNRMQPPGAGASGMIEGNEITSTWIYDTLRTPKILEAIGRPRLEVSFVLEPSRRRDELESPGLVHELRDMLAEKSLVVSPAGASKREIPVDPVEALPLPSESERDLDTLEPNAPPLETMTMWRDDGSPTTLFWLHAHDPASTSPLLLVGRIRDAANKTVVTVRREAVPALGFTTSEPAIVVADQVRLSPGTYHATYLLQDKNVGTIFTAGVSRIVVPARSESLAVSSLVLTESMQPAAEAAITIGNGSIRPRADATFYRNESVWYAFQLANVAHPEELKLKLLLRRHENSAVQMSDLPPQLQRTGPETFIAGYELPLTTLPEGNYSLYVTVTDAASHQESRRADFRVAANPSLTKERK